MTIKTFMSRLVPDSGPSALDFIMPNALSVPMRGPYPIRQHMTFEESVIGGELCLSFEDITVSPFAIDSMTFGVDGRTLEIKIKPSTLVGKYRFFGVESPEVDMDIGGLMGSFPTKMTDPQQEPPAFTEKQYFRLVELEQERAKLNQTVNGRLLVDRFNLHNDAYLDVFQTNEQLRTFWGQDGTSEEMGDHTSDALKSDAVINPTDRGFGAKNVSYNSNAFNQQLNLWAACWRSFPDAAMAALQFGDNVGNSTGNDETKTKEMSGAQVYESVNVASTSVLKGGPSEETFELEAALIRLVVHKNAIQKDIDICAARGYTMDSETIQRLQSIYQASLRSGDDKKSIPLRSGIFDIPLEESTFFYTVNEQPDGAVTLAVSKSTLRLPGFEMGISDWNNAITAEDTRFIRGLLIDRISSQLTRRLREISRRPQ